MMHEKVFDPFGVVMRGARIALETFDGFAIVGL